MGLNILENHVHDMINEKKKSTEITLDISGSLRKASSSPLSSPSLKMSLSAA
jgi:hypothetical protein